MVMASPLLETRLYVPRWRRGLVPRPRLSERLNAGAQSKLTLVSAPAGFGKTTLLAEWLAAAPAEERPTAWLSLDETDNRPASFWTYLITALQKVAPPICGSHPTRPPLTSTRSWVCISPQKTSQRWRGALRGGSPHSSWRRSRCKGEQTPPASSLASRGMIVTSSTTWSKRSCRSSPN